MTTLALGAMVVGAAAPASAAPPERMKQSGTFANLFSFTEDCREQGGSRTVCTNLSLQAFTIEDGRVVVCLDSSTFVLNRDRFTLRDQESGCTEVPADTLTVTDGLVATLDATTITLTGDGRRGGTREVTVSAQDSPIGPISTSSGRGSFKDGTCTFRFSFTERSAEVAGTITVDGTTFQESGFASVGSSTVTQSCR